MNAEIQHCSPKTYEDTNKQKEVQILFLLKAISGKKMNRSIRNVAAAIRVNHG
jgi:hypothetical protein